MSHLTECFVKWNLVLLDFSNFVCIPIRMTLALQHLRPPESLISRFDPRWKWVAFLLLVVAVVTLQTLSVIASTFVLSLVLVWISHLSGRWYRVRIDALLVALIPFFFLLPFTIDRGEILWQWEWLRFSTGGLVVALQLALKSMTIVTLMLVLLGTSPFHISLQAAQQLYVPRLLIQLCLLTYRYLFLLAEEFQKIRTALRVRGFRNRANRHSYRTIGHVTGTLIVRGSDRAERVAQAMRCRGFDGTFRSLTNFQTKTQDVLLFLLFSSCAIGFVIWDRWGL
jgi:cobalt/nickel transport system permease protein